MKDLCYALLLILALATFAQAQTAASNLPELKSGQEFKIVSTTKTSTFEQELQAAASQGFRLARLTKAFGDLGMHGLLSRVPFAVNPADKASYEYKVLATTRLATMDKELEAAAAEGYEFRGISTQSKLVPFSSGETLIVMERPVGETKRRFYYRLVTAQEKKTVQEELDEAVSASYTPVELILGFDSDKLSVLFGPRYYATIILGRDVNRVIASKDRREYRYLWTNKVSTMEKEMNQAAKAGFEFHQTSLGSMTLMTRSPGDKTPRYEYKLLATRRSSTMQQELTDAGKQGLRFLGTSSGMGGVVSVMEKNLSATSASQYDYKFLGVRLESTAQKELNEALAAHYQFIEITKTNERLIVLGKAQESK